MSVQVQKYRKNRVLAFPNKSNIEMRDARWLSQIQTCLLGVSLPKSLFPVPVLVALGHTKIALVPHLSPKREVFEKFELCFDYCFPYPRSKLTLPYIVFGLPHERAQLSRTENAGSP